MRKILAAVFLISILYSCKQKTMQVKSFYDHEGKILKEEYTVLSDSPEIRNGIYSLYNQSGKIIEVRNYLHNQLTDTLRRFYDEGIISEECIYKNNEINGYRKLFYKNGKVMNNETYLNGNFDGPYHSYYENGNIKEEGQYVSEVMQGVWKYFYETGELHQEVEFADNMENGFYKYYFKNGKVKEEGNYLNGKNDGIWKYCDETGIQIADTSWYEGYPVKK